MEGSRHHPAAPASGGIALTVTPKSSAFFSGETLEFAITFRNTRPRQHYYYPQQHQQQPPHSAQSTSALSPYQHSKHLSTSSLNHGHVASSSSVPSSAPPSRSAFGHAHAHSTIGLPAQHHASNNSRAPTPSRSYADLTTFASPDNKSGTSSHIVLPERKGIIGTPLALASTASTTSSTPITSPTQHLRRPISFNNPTPPNSLPRPTTATNSQASSSSLYPSKRVPNVRQHRKNDYSVASITQDDGEYAPNGSSHDDASAGVSDLSSQLAGMAILQQREGSPAITADEEAVLNAQPFVDQYKRQGDALQNRYPSINTNGSWRSTSGFSTISEDGGPHSSPPTSKRFPAPPAPRRSHSYSSAMSVDTTTARIPSSSSTTAFEALDQSNDYSPQSSFYGIGKNESVDSVLRDTVTDYTRPNTYNRPPSSSRSPSSSLRPSYAGNHGRSYSAAVGGTRPDSAPSMHLLSPNSATSEDLSLSAMSDIEAGTETLLWAFAQFNGSFTVEEALVKTGEFNAIKRSLYGGGSGAAASEYAIGGGSLDTEAAQSTPQAGTVPGKLASWLWGTNSGSSSSSTGTNNAQGATTPHSRESTYSTGGSLQLPADPVIDAAARRKSSSAAVQGPYMNSVHAMGSLEERRNRAMNDKNYPVFSSPPSILAVDLTLEPGESKTYNFSLQLPGDLPPSFRGKAISFQYTFMVGTNRAPNGALNEYKQHSRLIRIPVRIYNHVTVTGVRPFYDLTNPIIWSQDEAKITSEDDLDVEGDMLRMSKASRRRQRQRSSSIENAYAAARKSERKKDFLDYAGKLLDASAPLQGNDSGQSPRRSPSLPPPIDSEHERTMDDGGPASRPELMQRTSRSSSYAVLNGGLLGQDGEDTSCKSAVEIVSRNAQKVSYDINKDGYRIAVLTLVKSAYRLGDTVNVMISMNEGATRVLRLAARLETHELIETTVSIKPANQVRQLTRRLHAEHHETTLDSGRAGFALAIPSGATPDFATSGVKLQWSLRVSLLILPPQIPRSIPGMSGGYHHRPGSSTPATSPLALSSASSSSSSLPLPSPGHTKNRSLAFSGTSQPNTPVPVETGTHHLLPLPSIHPHQQYTSYRAVPDLSFIPTLFQSPEAQAASEKLGLAKEDRDVDVQAAGQGETVVLMPTKIETVEVNIPLRVYPSATPFRPHVSTFAV